VRSAQVISGRETGRSKGFGFVEMDTDAEAQAAIHGLHDQDHDGQHIKVDEAKPRVAGTNGFAGGSQDGSGRTGSDGCYGQGGGRRY
jgi:cold-inducible RNA-binding protein